MPEEVAQQYRGRVVFGPFSPVDAEEASALESELGQAIPPAYRSFLEVANGGTLPYSVRVPPGPQGEPVSFSELYRLGRDQHSEYGWRALLGEYRWLQQTRLAEPTLGGQVTAAHTPGPGGCRCGRQQRSWQRRAQALWPCRPYNEASIRHSTGSMSSDSSECQ